MPRRWRIILRVLAIASWIVSIIWLIRDFGSEEAWLASLGGTAAFITSFFEKAEENGAPSNNIASNKQNNLSYPTSSTNADTFSSARYKSNMTQEQLLRQLDTEEDLTRQKNLIENKNKQDGEIKKRQERLDYLHAQLTLQLSSKQFREADKTVSRILDLNPGDPEALKVLKWLEKRMGSRYFRGIVRVGIAIVIFVVLAILILGPIGGALGVAVGVIYLFGIMIVSIYWSREIKRRRRRR